MGDDRITRNIARILAARQAELGLSLRQIEEISGVTRMSVSRVLAGESAIPLDKFEAVARALGLIPWHVMREAEQSLDDQEATVIEMPTAQAVEVYDGSQPPAGIAAQVGDVGAEQGTPDDLGEYSQVPPEDWD